jgi:hypothetical protein
MQQEQSSLIVSFPLIFEGAFYDYARSCLELACRSSKRVFVCLRFAKNVVAFHELQSLLIHIYGTIVEGSNSLCSAVVVDPSVGLDRILTQSPWKAAIAGGSPCTGAAPVNIAWPALPQGFIAAFPLSSALVEPRVEHAVNGGTFDHLHNGHR